MPLDVVADGFLFTECPRWHEGRLYFADFDGGSLYVLDETGSATPVCEVEGRPGGFGWLPEGELVVASQSGRKLLRLEESGALTEVADLGHLCPGPVNDVLVDAVGRAYVGSVGCDIAAGDPIVSGAVLMVDTDGSVRVVADDLFAPNGMVLSADGATMYIAESFGFAVWEYDVDAMGRLSNRREFIRFRERLANPTLAAFASSGAVLPDGIALDAEGALWVSSPLGGGALRVREGQIVDRIDTGDLAVFAVVLGGHDRRTLYLCAGPPFGVGSVLGWSRESCIMACRVDVAGAGLQ